MTCSPSGGRLFSEFLKLSVALVNRWYSSELAPCHTQVSHQGALFHFLVELDAIFTIVMMLSCELVVVVAPFH